MIRLLFVLLVGAFPAMATQDGWPALYDVSGVASDDVLHVRAGPGTGTDIIGSLPPDATNVEVIRANDDLTWGLVSVGERAGWASLRFLARKSTNWDGQYPDFTACIGTEPFWHLKRSGGVLNLKRLDTETEITYPIDWESGSINHRGRHSFRAGDLVGVISGQLCGDGMSDREYGLEVNLIMLPEKLHLQGCCTIQPPAE